MNRITLFVLLILPASLCVNAQSIVADHSVVDEYANIPEFYKDKVKAMLFNIVGESHSRGYRYGLQLVENLDASFACDIRYAKQNPLDPGTTALRAHAAIRTASSWDNWVGEEDFWTTTWAVDQLKNHLDYCRTTLDNPVSVIGFAWCYDMTYTYAPQASYTDPAYDCKWYGGSKCWDGANFVERGAWGIDAADSAAMGGYRVTLQHYLRTIEALNAHSASVAVYTTSPMDGSDNTGERGYQRHIKNSYIRNHVAGRASEVLFDYADIVSYNNADDQQTASWNSNTFPVIHPDNYGSYNGGEGDCHLSEAGCLRLGKALWWMLARMAGWQSEPVNNLADAAAHLAIRQDAQTLYVELPETTKNQPVALYSTHGTKVYGSITSGTSVSISIGHLASGLYILKAGDYPPRKIVK